MIYVKFIYIKLLYYTPCNTRIEFEAPQNTIDYGTTSKTDNKVRSFEFKNTGNAPLLITRAESTLSSIVVTKPASAIMPGKKGKINIKYNNMAAGPIRKTITVESNAVNYPDGRVAIRIKGEVL